MKALGHGRRSDMTGAEALAVALAATPANPPSSGPQRPLGPEAGRRGGPVRADDYGRDPIEGRLVAVNSSGS